MVSATRVVRRCACTSHVKSNGLDPLLNRQRLVAVPAHVLAALYVIQDSMA